MTNIGYKIWIQEDENTPREEFNSENYTDFEIKIVEHNRKQIEVKFTLINPLENGILELTDQTNFLKSQMILVPILELETSDFDPTEQRPGTVKLPKDKNTLEVPNINLYFSKDLELVEKTSGTVTGSLSTATALLIASNPVTGISMVKLL
jgi:hypothetical protein